MHPPLASLLGRWHQWRRVFSTERGYSKVLAFAQGGAEDDDYENGLMRLIEDEIAALPRLQQLALQHAARAECLGVEVMHTTRLPTEPAAREALVNHACAALQRRLVAAGIL